MACVAFPLTGLRLVSSLDPKQGSKGQTSQYCLILLTRVKWPQWLAIQARAPILLQTASRYGLEASYENGSIVGRSAADVEADASVPNWLRAIAGRDMQVRQSTKGNGGLLARGRTDERLLGHWQVTQE
jgi:hypothetical protein